MSLFIVVSQWKSLWTSSIGLLPAKINTVFHHHLWPGCGFTWAFIVFFDTNLSTNLESTLHYSRFSIQRHPSPSSTRCWLSQVSSIKHHYFFWWSYLLNPCLDRNKYFRENSLWVPSISITKRGQWGNKPLVSSLVSRWERVGRNPLRRSGACWKMSHVSNFGSSTCWFPQDVFFSVLRSLNVYQRG